MIHFSCPCCEVSRLPHTDECTFHRDWPEGCADFNYVANLRSDLEAASAEVERLTALPLKEAADAIARLRLTNAERQVIFRVMYRATGADSAVLRSLLNDDAAAVADGKHARR